jgi:hypothetical protein
MGYREIQNLYKSKDILLFKQAWAMEKIHGTSAHISYSHPNNRLTFFSGGAKYDQFVNLFDQEKLLKIFSENAIEHNIEKITIYGEAYGGKLQGMSHTYGKDLKFIAFEVCLNDNNWMSVPQADRIATRLGFEFVHYGLIDTTEEAINTAMMADSIQAIRNGIGPGKMREGVVLRAPIELIHPNGGRIICKHKRPEFAEREHTPKIIDPEEIKVLEDAQAIAEEWCTHMRLMHVLDVFLEPKIEDADKVIKAMIADIIKESVGETIIEKAARKAIGKKTMKLFKDYLQSLAFHKE